MEFCNKCSKNSILQVATSDGIPFYSCCTEKCVNEAMLLVCIDDGEYVRYDKIYQTFRKIVNESDETDSKEGES